MQRKAAWTQFSAGEVSPRMDGQVFLESYYASCRQLKNMLIHPHGGAVRRGGLRYIAGAKHHDKAARLIPFIFSREQSYVIEMGHQYLRFYMGQGQIMDDEDPYEIASPYGEDQLDEVMFCQSGDVMYLTHPDLPPQKLSRAGHTDWTLAAVSFTGTPGDWGTEDYPGVAQFFEQRLSLIASPGKPITCWFSKSGAMEDLTTGSDPDSGLAFTLATDQVDRILWAVQHGRLVLGTASGVHMIGAAGGLEALTPENARADQATTYGAAAIKAIVVSYALIYVGRGRKRVYELAYSVEKDNMVPRDLTLYAEHLGLPKIREIAWAQNPDATLWAVRDDGVLLSGTYYPPERVLAWARHHTQGQAESVCTIPGAERDEVWLLVRRTVDGAERRFVELLEPPDNEEPDTCFFVDSGLSYYGEPLTELGGLDHLAGETVQVLADGATHPEVVVGQDGVIQLVRAAQTVHAGLGYESVLHTMRAEVGGSRGISQGSRQRAVEVLLRLYQTGGAFHVGHDADDLKLVELRRQSDPMDSPVPLSSKDKKVQLGSGHRDEVRIMLRQDLPLPLGVLAIIPEIEAND